MQQKSTNGRKPKPSVRAMRAWIGAVSRFAPGSAERQAARIFLTPRRRRARNESPPRHRDARSFTLKIAQHRLEAWSLGEGPLALLIHGWEGSADHMTAAAVRLADEGFRAVALDMPAHGRSPGRVTSLVEWISVLRALPAALGAPDVVIGHSFGASAVTFAIAEGLPARRAALLAPPLGPLHFVERARRFIGLPEARVPGMVRRLEELVGRDIAELDTSRAARAVTIPGLILHDPQDPEVPWSHAAGLAEAWSGSRLEPCDGVGHYRIVGDAAVLDALSSFVRHESRFAAPEAPSHG